MIPVEGPYIYNIYAYIILYILYNYIPQRIPGNKCHIPSGTPSMPGKTSQMVPVASISR